MRCIFLSRLLVSFLNERFLMFSKTEYYYSGGRLYRIYVVKVRKEMLEAPLDLLDLSSKLHSD